MRRRSPLYLHEETLLLALRDREGTIAASDAYRFALGGAILAELLLGERIAVDPNRRRDSESGLGAWLSDAFSERNLIDLADDTAFGDSVLDECLGRIAGAKRRASLKTWVQRFAGLSKLNHRIAESLCDRGVLRADTGTVLLIFKRKVYPELDPKPERELIQRLRKAIFTEATDLDPRTVVILSLANNAELLTIPFEKKKLRGRKKRIERITNGELMGKATKEAVQAAQAAVAAAAIVPCIVATSCH